MIGVHGFSRLRGHAVMSTLYARSTVALSSMLTLALCASGCGTVGPRSTLGFHEVEAEEVAKRDAEQEDDAEAVEVLPAQVDIQFEGVGQEVEPCASGCDKDPGHDSSDEAEEDSTQEEENSSQEEGESSQAEGDSTHEDESRQKIDFLFVIDNSGSMKDEQKAIAASAPGFIRYIQEKLDLNVDVHAGVVLTGEINRYSRNFGSECEVIGTLIRETDGRESSRAVCYPEGQPKFSTGDSDLVSELECALRPGISGSGEERPMDAILGALSPGLAMTPDCNQGFIREDALLVITLLTDEEDDRRGTSDGILGSKGGPRSWTRKLLELRGGVKESVVVLGLIGTEDGNCDPLIGPEDIPSEDGAQISKRLEAFVRSFGDQGLVGDVCARRYDTYFEKATRTVYRALLRYRR